MALNIAVNLIKPLETSSSIGMFARDTGGCLISRLGLARSKDEAREVSVAELSESLIFYFSAPFLAKLFSNFFSNKFNLTKEQFNTPLKEAKNVPSDILKNIKLAKFSQITSVFSLVLPAVFAIAPIRNFVTLSKTGKDKFASVIDLDKEKSNKKPEKSKSSFIKKILLASSAMLIAGAGAVGMAKKSDNFYNKIEPFLDKFTKIFEFTSSGDLELLHYGALIYPVSVLSYFLSSRDKYEVLENLRRFSITIPMMFFGEKIVQNPIYRAVDKKFKTNLIDKNGIKKYSDIFKMSENSRAKALKSKNIAQLSTFLINTVALAGAVTLINRFETKRKFNKENNKNA